MAEQKIVSLEDRIPKLKKERRRRANRKLIIYVTIFFFLVFIIVYLQSPLSTVQKIEVTGTQWLSEQEIKELSQLKGDENFWKISLNEVEKQIAVHPTIESVSAKRKFPHTLVIEVNEWRPVAFIQTNNEIRPLLENGTVLDSAQSRQSFTNLPFIYGLQEDHLVEEFARQLSEMPAYIANLISEIYWVPEEVYPYQIRMYMSDGYELLTSLSGLANNLTQYPSIVNQLETKEGILKIDASGAVFTPKKKPIEEQTDEG